MTACVDWRRALTEPASPGAAGQQGVASPALKPPITYVALGASDAAGVGVEDPARDGWVAILARRLPQPTRLVNLGIPGVRLHEAVEVQLPPALESQPQLITIWLVVNDILSGIPVDEYRADLHGLLSELRARTKAQVAIGNVPNAPEGTGYLGLTAAQRRAVSGEWNAAIDAAAKEHDALVVDLHSRWPVIQNPHFIGPDRLHPTAEGYRALAETFHTVLREHGVV
jgi:acyl-CoA thioesterase I